MDLRVAGLVVMAHEQFGRMNEEADELLWQLAHRETALRSDRGAGDPREANQSSPAAFGAVLASSRKLFCVGLAKQSTESVTLWLPGSHPVRGACCSFAGGLGVGGRRGPRVGGSWS